MLMESMEWTCNYCGGIGKVDYPSHMIERCALIICLHCSKPSAYVWCPNCGMGGQIAKTEFLNFPKTWQCIECWSEYGVPKDFYETKIVFTPEYFVDLTELDIASKKYITVPWIRSVLELWEKKFGHIFLVVTTLAVGSLIVGAVERSLNIRFSQLLNNFLLWTLVTFPVFLVLNLIVWVTPKVFWVVYKLRKI